MRRFSYFFILTVLVAGLALFLMKDQDQPQVKVKEVAKPQQPKKFFSIKEEKYSEDSTSKRVKPSAVKESKIEEPAAVGFSYEKEVQKVKIFAQKLPQSKNQLVAIAVAADPFKGKKIKPHTVAEIQHNKMGAVKVLALKALMQMKDKREISSNLDLVILKAQDPTIVKIAQAAKESLGQGRSFFDDFPDAVQSL